MCLGSQCNGLLCFGGFVLAVFTAMALMLAVVQGAWGMVLSLGAFIFLVLAGWALVLLVVKRRTR